MKSRNILNQGCFGKVYYLERAFLVSLGDLRRWKDWFQVLALNSHFSREKHAGSLSKLILRNKSSMIGQNH